MTQPRSVADVPADHVVFEVECIDRMYCNLYVPQLHHTGGLLGYIQRRLGLPIASTAPLGKLTDAFAAAMRRFARHQRVPWVDFAKGQRKDGRSRRPLGRGPLQRAAVTAHRRAGGGPPGLLVITPLATPHPLLIRPRGGRWRAPR
jgi:hypothetical protein